MKLQLCPHVLHTHHTHGGTPCSTCLTSSTTRVPAGRLFTTSKQANKYTSKQMLRLQYSALGVWRKQAMQFGLISWNSSRALIPFFSFSVYSSFLLFFSFLFHVFLYLILFLSCLNYFSFLFFPYLNNPILKYKNCQFLFLYPCLPLCYSLFLSFLSFFPFSFFHIFTFYLVCFLLSSSFFYVFVFLIHLFLFPFYSPLSVSCLLFHSFLSLPFFL